MDVFRAPTLSTTFAVAAASQRASARSNGHGFHAGRSRPIHVRVTSCSRPQSPRFPAKVLLRQWSPTSLSWVRWPMEISFARHQFPPDIIRHAVWLYLRFTLSFRDVEDLLAERGLEVSYETVRRWVLKFGPLFAKELRRRGHRPTSKWHLDEMAVLIAGRRFLALASGRRRRRGSRSAGATATRQDCSLETDAQAAQKARLRARRMGD